MLFYRELGFGLDEIAEILADPADGTDDHLRRQHRLLRERAARTQALLRAVEKEMEARDMGMALTPEEQFEVFGTDKMAEYTGGSSAALGGHGCLAGIAAAQRREYQGGLDHHQGRGDATVRGFAEAGPRPGSRPPGRPRWIWPRRTGST